METFRDIYKRFKTNYHTETGGINIYPQFDYDLEQLLHWIEGEMDWSNPEVDCAWRPVKGE